MFHANDGHHRFSQHRKNRIAFQATPKLLHKSTVYMFVMVMKSSISFVTVVTVKRSPQNIRFRYFIET